MRILPLSGILLLAILALTAPLPVSLPAQENGPANEPAAATEPAEEERSALIEQRLNDTESLTLVGLILSGGRMMIPLGIMSVAVVALTFERLFALRRSRIVPYRLQRELSQLRLAERGLDPREAYKLCNKYPSALASAVKAMLQRIGRPQSEVEHAVAEATEREAERLYGNVRWIALMGSVAPLLGLMGTVWGIIWTFYETTQLEIGADRADQLAGGIFVALVTTLGGLTIAIPAMIISQYFESRIIKLIHEMDEILFDLIPGFEHYEGKLRAKHRKYEGTPGATAVKTAAKPADPPRPPASTGTLAALPTPPRGEG